MNFDGYTVLDIYGAGRVELAGDYDATWLAHKLVEEWVSCVECETCGRHSYCRYAKPLERYPDKFAEIQCGVIVEFIGNFVKHTFHLLEKMEPEQIQNYLDGLFYLARFVKNAEHTIGAMIWPEYLQWLGTSAPFVLSWPTNLREDLNLSACHFQNIPEFAGRKGILLVEGQSEKAFLDKLRESHLWAFLNLRIDVYEGNANRKPGKLQMLLERYARQGYIVYIQGDADGKGKGIFDDLIRKKMICLEYTFAFRYDFETAIPARILFEAIRSLGKLDGVKLEDFERVSESKDQSVVITVKEAYNLDLIPLKR